MKKLALALLLLTGCVSGSPVELQPCEIQIFTSWHDTYNGLVLMADSVQWVGSCS